VKEGVSKRGCCLLYAVGCSSKVGCSSNINSIMEIHRRTTKTKSSQPSNSTTNAIRIDDEESSSSNSTGIITTFRAGKRSASTTSAQNPYNNTTSSTIADVVLFRLIQFLILLVAVWFLDLLLSSSSPADVISQTSLRGNENIPTIKPGDFISVRTEITHMREEFYTRYGGEDVAMKMLKRGLIAFHDDDDTEKTKNTESSGPVRATANRFLNAIVRHESLSSTAATKITSRPEFVMAFAGYSVTVGRGNHLEQSYPYVFAKILSPILAMSPFNINLIVRNSAIGGIPSFPYGWCLRNFLGDDADSVSWDYAMNEGNGASGLEAYIRQSLMMPKSPPLFILLDVKSRPRLDMLQRYVDLGGLPDPIALGGKDAVDKRLLQLPEQERPSGLQKWDEWGAPLGAPGQSSWHAKKMEHELMAWMLVMRMLESIDVALDVMERDVNWRDRIITEQQRSSKNVLPSPVIDGSKNWESSLLHGTETKPGEWHMSRISCRTSFLPNISGDLNSIIQSGVTKDDEDMMQIRDNSLFNGGWVMDVGKVERETKLKVQTYGGLGYIDMKIALYGIPSSGTLNFWLPYEGHDNDAGETHPPDENASASEYFNSVILCEVNEKRGDEECKMVSDLMLRLGGAAVSEGDVSQVTEVASYLKKNICIRLGVPADARISKNGKSDFGLSLEVAVSGAKVSRENGACSISHVIWENKCGHIMI